MFKEMDAFVQHFLLFVHVDILHMATAQLIIQGTLGKLGTFHIQCGYSHVIVVK